MMYKQAYSNPEFRKLVRLARPFYNYMGANDWSHIQDVRRRANAMTHKLYGRGLTPAEYAAVLFHDSTKHEMGADNHGRMGGLRAAEVLAVAMPKEQLAEAVEAISVHDDNLPKFPSQTAELLASADANPPDLGFVLNKGWKYGIKHGFNEEQQVANLSSDDGVSGMYRRGGSFHYPDMWNKYYGKAGEDYKDTLSKLYRNKEGMKQMLKDKGLIQ